MWDKAKLTHNLGTGDWVHVKGMKSTARVADVCPLPHWENCVKLDAPLQGWIFWDANELEKADGPHKKRRR